MYKHFLYFTYAILTLVTMGVINGYANDRPYGIPANVKVFTEVHGDAINSIVSNLTEVHIHGVVFVENQANLNSEASGSYTIVLEVKEKDGANWGRDNYEESPPYQGSFEDGITLDVELSFNIDPQIDLRDMSWTASATLRHFIASSGKIVTYTDYDEKKEDELDENEDWKDAQNDVNQPPALGILPSDPNQIPQPGDSVTLNPLLMHHITKLTGMS